VDRSYRPWQLSGEDHGACGVVHVRTGMCTLVVRYERWRAKRARL